MLPVNVAKPLQRHLQRVRAQHEEDLEAGFGRVYLPFALTRKFPNAGREWAWQYVFPSPRLSVDPRSEDTEKCRHHLNESVLQDAVKTAVRASGISKPARDCWFTHRSSRPLKCASRPWSVRFSPRRIRCPSSTPSTGWGGSLLTSAAWLKWLGHTLSSKLVELAP